MLTLGQAARDRLLLSRLEVCTLTKINRSDGAKFFWTDHDEDVVYPYRGHPAEKTYTPRGAISLGADQRQAGLQPHTRTARGVIRSDAFTTKDLQAGRWNGAKVTQLLVPWRFPSEEQIIGLRFFIANASWTGEEVECELRALTNFMTGPSGILLEKNCRHASNFGAAFGTTKVGCKFDVASGSEYSVEVDMVDSTNRIITATTGTLPSTADNHWRHGNVLFRTGENVGLGAMKIGAYTDSSRLIALIDPAPCPIEPGDLFEISPGCSGERSECSGYGQIPNFLGFDKIPTEEELSQTGRNNS